MNDIALMTLPKSKEQFLRWLKRLGSLPDAYRATSHQPYLRGLDASKKAHDYITKMGIEDECYAILDNFSEMQVQEPLTREELGLKVSEMVINPHIKPVDSLKAAEVLMRLNGWEIKKTQSEILTAKADFQDMLNSITNPGKKLSS